MAFLNARMNLLNVLCIVYQQSHLFGHAHLPATWILGSLSHFLAQGQINFAITDGYNEEGDAIQGHNNDQINCVQRLTNLHWQADTETEQISTGKALVFAIGCRKLQKLTLKFLRICNLLSEFHRIYQKSLIKFKITWLKSSC